MTTLYDVLNDVVGDDVSQRFTPGEIQDISNRITDKLKKKLGDSEFDKLENYITNNKDDKYFKDLAEHVIEAEGLKDFFMGDDDKKDTEVRIGYKSLKRLYKLLEDSGYDAEQAYLDLDSFF